MQTYRFINWVDNVKVAIVKRFESWRFESQLFFEANQLTVDFENQLSTKAFVSFYRQARRIDPDQYRDDLDPFSRILRVNASYSY